MHWEKNYNSVLELKDRNGDILLSKKRIRRICLVYVIVQLLENDYQRIQRHRKMNRVFAKKETKSLIYFRLDACNRNMLIYVVRNNAGKKLECQRKKFRVPKKISFI